MRYLDWVMIVVSITLSISLVNSLGIVPSGSGGVYTETSLDSYQSGELIDETTGTILKQGDKETLAYKISKYELNRDYSPGGVVGDTALYTDGDFLTGMVTFTEVFSNGVFEIGDLYDTLTNTKTTYTKHTSHAECTQLKGDYNIHTEACIIENNAARSIKYIIIIPLLFIFSLAVIQLITGRNVGQME